MQLRRVCTPSRFLFWCVVAMAFFVVLMIYDTFRECESEELRATKRLLDNYHEQNQELKNDQFILKKKLKEAEQQLSSLSSDGKSKWVPGLPVIYLITPTYTRMEQKAELTRLSQTLMHVKNIHWIVIEDADAKTNLVARFLKQTGFNYTHLNVATPAHFKLASNDPSWLKPRGVLQRNAGLAWLRSNTKKQPGVLFFVDDDNTYSLRLFEEMRFTKKVSVWPVGIVGYLRYETPIVTDGKVTGWFTYFKPTRPFPMDMAGFAVNLALIHSHPGAGFSNEVERGYQESTFLTGLGVTLDDLEPKANMCSEVLVWHTRTEKSSLRNEEKMWKKYGLQSDPNIEV
ncbi:galactosylgalactosylxylosylprotein 3-beta-glucuronosyltransferase 2 [Aplysia californica]|uniref:Galactosylgalactosylxylosylprotein 3-beta-glucuronosyltransferase n=1 Tax=Aplysia californica TaxID=6500 RepID=A0ABM0K236_APLCA|nr:galactosylgalactosylxylosylprotein 3-beta-glucuronosyltransferase 2 [Aplysia californica]